MQAIWWMYINKSQSIQQEQQLHTLLQNQKMFILNLTILWSDCIRFMFVCLIFLGKFILFIYILDCCCECKISGGQLKIHA